MGVRPNAKIYIATKVFLFSDFDNPDGLMFKLQGKNFLGDDFLKIMAGCLSDYNVPCPSRAQ
ncbi:MAG TPA: hypothetical protein DCQ08_00380 [Amoebophilaceae bacterium]|nr:hypothetical protein [Amoebophilaceae bacterium]